jgi:hypothetical protein
MKPIDFARAAGVAIGILVLNVLVSVVVVLVYRFLIEPGHPDEFYDAAAMRIAPWCSHTAGTALFFVASYLSVRRRPERNGFLFASTVTFFYALIDGAIVSFAGSFAPEFVLSLLAKLAAGLAGAFLAMKRSRRA